MPEEQRVKLLCAIYTQLAQTHSIYTILNELISASKQIATDVGDDGAAVGGSVAFGFVVGGDDNNTVGGGNHDTTLGFLAVDCVALTAIVLYPA